MVLSVSAYWPGAPPANSAAAARTSSSSPIPSSSACSVSKPSRARWKSIAAWTWAVCGDSTNAANWDISGSSGNWARTDSQSVGSKSGTTSPLGGADGVAVVGGRGIGVVVASDDERGTSRQAGSDQGASGRERHGS